MDYPGLVENFQNNSSVEKFLQNNQPATEKINVPVMIIQGTADMAVPYPVTNTLQQGLKDMGTTVNFVEVENASHTEAIVESRTPVADLHQYLYAFRYFCQSLILKGASAPFYSFVMLGLEQSFKFVIVAQDYRL